MSVTSGDQLLVLVDVADGVATVTWNRPERNNAYSIPMEVAYYGALEACEADPAVRVIVVTGAGKSFCPGMDTDSLAEQVATGTSTVPHLRTPATYPLSVAKPIIAAINGACAGMGMVAALNCDMRFASSRARFTTAFAQRGIMAEHGLAWTLPRLVGTSKALDLLYSARIFEAAEALELGVVDRVFDENEFMERVLDYARSVAANSSPTAMGVIKRQVYAGLESSHEEARTLAIRYWYDVVKPHDDFGEGVHSYLERRQPRFAPWNPDTTSDPAPLPTD